MKLLLTLSLLCLSSISFSQDWLKTYEKARNLHEEGYRDSARTFYVDVYNQLDTTKIDTNLANVLYYMYKVDRWNEKWGQALDLALKCVRVYKELGSTHNKDLAFMYSEAGYCYTMIGDYEKAISTIAQSRETYAEVFGKKHRSYVKTCQLLGDSYSHAGKYEQAFLYYNEALELWKNRDKKDPDYPQLCNNVALLQQTVGNYDKAYEYYLECRKYNELLAGKEDYGYAVSCLNLGDLKSSLGEYEVALNYYVEAKSSWEKYQDTMRYEYFVILNNMAGLYRDLGDLETALPMFERGLALVERTLGKNHPYYAGLNLNYAIVWSYLDKDSIAEKRMKESLLLFENTVGKEHPSYGYNLYSIASLYAKKKEFKEAQKLFEKALEIRQNSLGKNHEDVAASKLKLGEVYLKIGEMKKAEQELNATIQILEESLGQQHPKTSASLMKLSHFYLVQGDPENAEKFALQSIKGIKDNVWKNFAFLSEKGKADYLGTINTHFDQFFSMSTTYRKSNQKLVENAYDLSLFRKGIVLRSSTQMRFAISRSGNPDLLKVYDEWLSLKKQITAKLNQAGKKENDLLEMEAKAKELEQELVKKSGVFEELRNRKQKSWKTIQSELKPKELAIEFVRFEEGEDSIRYCALLLDAKMKSPKLIPLFLESELESAFNEVSGTDNIRIEKLYDPQGKLFELVWKPLEKTSKKYRKIYYSPAGLLHRVAFSALSKKEGVLLCDNMNLEHRNFAFSNRENSSNLYKGTTTLFGGVDYNTGEDNEEIWSYLPGTKTEADAINKLLVQNGIHVNYLFGKEAKEERLKDLASKSNILHLSTHGFFYPDPEKVRNQLETEYIQTLEFRGNSVGKRGFGTSVFLRNKNPMMRTGLTLAGANRVWNTESVSDGEDGVLTAKEVSNLDMTNTGLVVLSACETGLGDIQGSEGVYGLQRAFKIAGAHYILMSLWQVPDKETAEFMTHFYENLFEIKDVKEAFSATQKIMRQKYDPYFWAAFVLVD